ncbi:tautomerase family protein [Cohnella silvisoli]|uniref:Tautomerase family protein n=1 Tax=Cohnella silvisoli TaxID=2873699 RepID=A0ABV1KX62_9BACL|nr:tautomerase family protein [Cohnella silvisoli]MCD9023839.1 tautomerase family protein [Cohnella silvisoli]
MPYITVKLMEGRSSRRIKLLAAKMTEAVCETLEIKPSDVRIEFVELKAGTFAVAGQIVPEIKDSEGGSQHE